MKQRIVQTAVEFAASSLKHHVAFIHRVFNFIIDTRAVRQLENGVLSESVKELHSFCIHQLQRLALRSFDELIVSFISSIITLSWLIKFIAYTRSHTEEDRGILYSMQSRSARPHAMFFSTLHHRVSLLRKIRIQL